MAIIMHPLTAKNGSPEYTADDYRHARRVIQRAALWHLKFMRMM